MENHETLSVNPTPWRTAAQVILGALAVPLIVTGGLRLSDAVPMILPFLLTGAAGGILVAMKRHRSVGIGLIIGTIAYAVIVNALFVIVGGGMKDFG